MASIISLRKFDQTDIAAVISINHVIVTSRIPPQRFGVKFEKLVEIFEDANSLYTDLPDKRKAVIMTAGHIMAGIAYWQPFDEGNKTTALTVTRRFLRDNGYLLPIKAKSQKNALFDLMRKTIEKFELNIDIYSDTQEYLEKNVKSLT